MNSQLCPLVKVAAALAVGIIVGDRWGSYLPIYAWLSLVAFSTSLVVLLRKKVLFSSVMLLLSLMFLGVTLVCMREKENRAAGGGSAQEYRAVVTSQPEERGKVAACDLTVLTDKGNMRIRGAIMKDSLGGRYRQLEAGSGIVFYSRIDPLKRDGAAAASSYGRWLQVHGYEGRTFIPCNNWRRAAISLRRLSRTERARLSLLRLRRRMADRLRGDGFSGETLGVVLAMTLGDRGMLTKEMRRKFSDAGTAHLLALSGLHMGVFYGFFLLFLRRMRRRVAVEALAVSTVWAYVFLVGMPVSAVRAATMLTVSAVVSLRSGGGVSLNSLSFAAIVLLLCNPLALWDVGFQLSFLAVAGILLWFRVMPLPRPRSLSLRLWSGFLSYVMVALSAQAATFPIVMHVFGSFPTYFLLSSLVAVPVAMAAVYAFMAYWLLVPVPLLHDAAGMVLASLTEWLLRLLEWIGSLPNASIGGIHINKAQTVCLYLLMACCYGIVYYARKVRRSATT